MKSESRDVEANLVVDGGVLAKHNVAADKACSKGMPAQLQSACTSEIILIDTSGNLATS